MPPPSAMIVPFARWMEEALYAPDRGYYSRNIATVGARGDFSTSATMTPVLGKAVWRWIDEELAFHAGTIRDVIEVGAGDGSLMHSVLRARVLLRRLRDPGLRFHIVERSPVLAEHQRATLGGRRISWHCDMAGALAACGGRAVVFSNELVDAFPVVQLRWSGEAWMEL